jgi:hypothetical protein
MIRIALFIGMIFILLALIAACAPATPTPVAATATPVVIVETVVVKETVPVEVEKEVEKIVTVEVEKEVEKVVTVEVEKEVTVVQTVEVEVEKEVEVIQTVEVVKVVTVQVQVTPTLTPEPTADRTDPRVREVMNQIPLVQHHHDPDSGTDTFTCASRGLGLAGVKADPRGPRFVGPNSADFDLYGVAVLFKISPDGTIELVPQETGSRWFDPEGIEHESATLEQALELFASGDAKWLGVHGEAGRVAECDPQFKTPTPQP